MNRKQTVPASDPPAQAADDRLLTPAEVAERLNVTERFVYRMVAERRVRFVRVGSRYLRFRPDYLNDFISEPSVVR